MRAKSILNVYCVKVYQQNYQKKICLFNENQLNLVECKGKIWISACLIISVANFYAMIVDYITIPNRFSQTTG